MKVIYFSLTLTLLLTIDLWNVSVRYLNNSRGENSKYNAWESKQEKLMPFIPTFSDEAIMNNEIALNKEYENKIKEFIDVKTLEKGSELTYRELDCKRFSKLNQLTNYRVLLLGNILREASISYFHKSLGGYHAAKIQRYQDFIEKKFKEQMVLANDISTLKNAHILHMLNTKYIILNQNENGKFLSQKDSVFSAEKKKAAIGFINDFAYGNAWFVNEVKAYNSPNDEFTALDTEDLRAIAITDERFKNNKDISGQYKYNGNETVKMISYKANEIKYSLENIIGGEHYMVFSEIYYPLGWKAYVNGDEIQINRVNYLLRGVKIPEGAKEVTLRYELKSFTVLSTISLISSILMILIIIGFGSFSFYKEKEGLRTL